jgi:putative membrane protein
MKEIHIVGAIALALTLTSPALAAITSQTMAAPKGTGSPDQAFMLKAAKGGMLEVQLGNIAIQRGGKDSQVFGAQMVKDHGAANKELMSLAAKLGVKLPTSLDPQQQTNIARLQKLSGQAFDNAYLRMMHEDHANDIKEFKTEVATGKDPQVKSWAASVVPVIQGHFAMNHKLMANHKGMDTTPMGVSHPMTGGGAGH